MSTKKTKAPAKAAPAPASKPVLKNAPKPAAKTAAPAAKPAPGAKPKKVNPAELKVAAKELGLVKKALKGAIAATPKPPKTSRPLKPILIVPIFPAVTGLGILKVTEVAGEFNNRLELLLRSLPLQLAVHYRQRATPFIGSDMQKPMTGVYIGFLASQSIPAPAFVYYSSQLDRWSYFHDTWDGMLSAMNGGNDAPGLRPASKKAIPDIFYWSGFNHDPMEV
jgi:hypothetical protein